MKHTRISILTTMLVANMSQAQLANQYAVTEVKMSRAMNGHATGVPLLTAINADYPAIDTNLLAIQT